MLYMAHYNFSKIKIIKKGVEKNMSEQDRLNANDYHYSNYEKIYNAKDLAEAKAIALEEMRIISEDNFIENDEEGKILELAYDDQSQN